MKKLLINRWIQFLLLFCALFAVVFLVDPDGYLRQRTQYLVFDYYLKHYPRQTTGDVMIVDIDDESLSRLGQWPWSRTVIADIIRDLNRMGVSAIGFDGVLAEPDRTSPSRMSEYLPPDVVDELKQRPNLEFRDNDVVLGKAIGEAGNFIGAFSYGTNESRPRIVSPILSKKDVKEHFLKHAQQFTGVAKFLPVFETELAGNGSFMAEGDVDSVIRRTGMILSDGRDIYPSLATEVLRVSFPGAVKPVTKLGVNKKFDENRIDTEYRMLIEKREIPIDDRGMLWVHYRVWDKERDYIPAWRVLDEASFLALAERLKGKIVLIGSSAEGLLDLRPTPLGLYPGVEIHVNAIEQVLHNRYLLRPRIIRDTESNFVLLAGLLTIFLAPFVGVLWLAAIYGGMTAFSFYLSHALFLERGFLIDPFYPAAAALLIFMLSSVLTYLRTEAERRQVKQAFGLYISPDFMKELTKDPDKLRLGGETRDLSVMFTDIRSFTTISESMSPEALIQLMNDFLTPMSDTVMNARGTIDKYMGDAMMAFWNAPLDDPDHARHACLAALKMSEALAPINKRLEEEAKGQGRPPVVLNAGIGINTGPAAVGNMGSKQRFAYSVMGDTVNLASRLEGQTKTYGVNILIGPETQKQVPSFATLELDLLRVKGKKEPVRVFSLLGDEVHAATDDFRAWKKEHDAMIEHYRARDFDGAERRIGECKRLSGGGLSEYYAMYLERVAEMRKNPPDAGWDGSFTAASK